MRSCCRSLLCALPTAAAGTLAVGRPLALGAQGSIPARRRGWTGCLGGTHHRLWIKSLLPVPVEGQSQSVWYEMGGPASLPRCGLGWLASCLL